MRLCVAYMGMELFVFKGAVHTLAVVNRMWLARTPVHRPRKMLLQCTCGDHTVCGTCCILYKSIVTYSSY